MEAYQRLEAWLKQNAERFRVRSYAPPRGEGWIMVFAGDNAEAKRSVAAELAKEWERELHRYGATAVVGKYIGETEKNLERLLTAAESSKAVLLIEEADALFGERTAEEDSHGRYANQETQYLLQKLAAGPVMVIFSLSKLSVTELQWIEKYATSIELREKGEDE